MTSQENQGMEYHVAKHGADDQAGTFSAPFKTIMAAARVALPGDTITIHEGVYREYIDPPRGGESDDKRIIYRAAPGENVVIKGSEVVEEWVQVEGSVWKTVIPHKTFGGFNPFTNLLGGDWFFPQGREHHSAQVYIEDEAIDEASNMQELFPVGDQANGKKWFSANSEWDTTVWANFGELNPTEQLVEVNVRQAVFYPSQPGINYITVQGLTLSQAATPWSPPTTEQIGLIGVNWSKGWIIEDNIISHSRCTGITLGKYFDRVDGSIQYGFNAHFQAVERVLERGDWSSENIGHHIIRNNHISRCEQSGIVGSHGGAFCLIEGNVIHDIHVRKLFGGFEQAGIKLHAPVDTVVRNNLIFNSHLGIWFDWMTQGGRMTGNVMYGNSWCDIFHEISHGPLLVDNNILLSNVALLDSAQGGAYVHNLFGGEVQQRAEGARRTHYFTKHGTTCLGIESVGDGDDRFYNNILLHESGLASYDKNEHEVKIDHNLYVDRAQAPQLDQNPNRDSDTLNRFRIEHRDGVVTLFFPMKAAWRETNCSLINTEMLGEAIVPKQGFEHPDGSSLVLDEDCRGEKRHPMAFPGPLELGGEDEDQHQIWPLRGSLKVDSIVSEATKQVEQEPR